MSSVYKGGKIVVSFTLFRPRTEQQNPNNSSHSTLRFQPTAFTSNHFLAKTATPAHHVSSSTLFSTTEDKMPAVGQGFGGFTASNSENRRVVPESPGDRPVFKVVYVVLESQYQSSMTAAVKRINAGSKNMAVECVGYLLEEVS